MEPPQRHSMRDGRLRGAQDIRCGSAPAFRSCLRGISGQYDLAHVWNKMLDLMNRSWSNPIRAFLMVLERNIMDSIPEAAVSHNSKTGTFVFWGRRPPMLRVLRENRGTADVTSCNCHFLEASGWATAWNRCWTKRIVCRIHWHTLPFKFCISCDMYKK